MQEDESLSSVAGGVAVGPFAGYKLIAPFGLTAFLQFGAEYLAARAKAEDSSTGASTRSNESKVIVLLNLNLGWSF